VIFLRKESIFDGTVYSKGIFFVGIEVKEDFIALLIDGWRIE
jgi:hypothetical protein